MKRKKLLSTAVAGMLVAAQMVMPVMAADGGSFNVTVTTKTPVLRVVVPTSMEIAVNQFEVRDTGSQIYSNEFTMENKSEIPVKVSVTSTATTPDTTTLVATKAAATGSTKAGEAWLAVAAQTSGGKYIEESGKGIKDLTEASANVTTFKEKKAEQTYYLDASTTMAYKLLNAGESAVDINYAQFYELTPKTFTNSQETAELKDLAAKQDVFQIATASIADGAALTKVDATDSSLTWANANTYYIVATTATAKGDIDAAKLYVYGDGNASTTAATTGSAAFRYIGKLSGKQETWTATDLTTIAVAYTITGVSEDTYDALAGQTGVLTYGLYVAPSKLSAQTVSVASPTLTVANGYTIQSVSVSRTNGTSQVFTEGGNYTLATNNNVQSITFTEGTITYPDNAGATVTITFSDNSTETVSFN